MKTLPTIKRSHVTAAVDLNLSRRKFLAATAGAASTLLFNRAFAEDAQTRLDYAFWQVSDTHFLADKNNPDKLDEVSLSVNDKVIDLLNKLPGSDLPEKMGGGALANPIGVIHTGDTIDSGNGDAGVHPQMQKTEWAAYLEHYGLNGNDGKCKYPVYELCGNHDAPHGTGLVVEAITQRTKKRPGVSNTSSNGVHYSWDWGPVHFVSLGITVGASKETTRKRFFNSLDSYDFLLSDLKEKVGDSGRPIVLCHHIDIARYTGPCDPTAPLPPGRTDWDPCDVHAFYKAIQNYNVLAILYGHTHVRNVYQWDGLSAKAKTGIHVFNCDDAAHFRGGAHGILHYHLSDTTMTVREYATKDHWKTAGWTQMWKVPIKLPVHAA
jgi:hypothetical protein